jgi:hypothetical protein
MGKPEENECLRISRCDALLTGSLIFISKITCAAMQVPSHYHRHPVNDRLLPLPDNFFVLRPRSTHCCCCCWIKGGGLGEWKNYDTQNFQTEWGFFGVRLSSTILLITILPKCSSDAGAPAQNFGAMVTTVSRAGLGVAMIAF